MVWGYHLIINAGRCDPAAIRSKATIAEFSRVLVKTIQMKAFGPPRIVRFGHKSYTGNTLIQLIESSDITAHFIESSNDAYFDLFSCKSFNKADAIAVFKEFFRPTTIETRFIKRQAKY
jgi:S-adenosylmethionine/arginine decarboxylase-like enzyme